MKDLLLELDEAIGSLDSYDPACIVELREVWEKVRPLLLGDRA
jgi:hypothetical protein